LPDLPATAQRPLNTQPPPPPPPQAPQALHEADALQSHKRPACGDEGVLVSLPPVEPRRRFPGTIRMFNSRPRSLSIDGRNTGSSGTSASGGDSLPQPLPREIDTATARTRFTTADAAPSTSPRLAPAPDSDDDSNKDSARPGRWGLLGASWDFLGLTLLGAGGGAGSAIVEDAVSVTVRLRQNARDAAKRGTH